MGAVTADAPGELIADVGTRWLGGGTTAELLWNSWSATAAVAPPGTKAVLSGCGEWRSRAAHAQVLCAGFGPGKAASAEQAVRALAQEGLLVGCDVAASEPRRRPPRIQDFAVITHGRSALAGRCVRGFLRNAVQAGHRGLRICVIDDAPLAAGADTRATVEAVASRGEARLRYVGRQAKERLARALSAQSGVALGLVRFAILGSTGALPAIGANRNCQMLLGAGRAFACVDDDVQCRASAPFGAPVPPALSSGEPLDFRPYTSAREALAENPELAFDFLGAAGRWMGKSAWQCLAEGSGHPAPGPTWIGVGPRRVAVTYFGILGDSAMERAAPYLLFRGDARARMLASEATYRATLRARQLLRLARGVVLTEAGPGTTAAVAMDARSLLPPFFPCFRSEDAAFAMVLRHVGSEQCVVHIPLALLHAPYPPRSLTAPVWSMAPQVGFRELLAAGVATLRPAPAGSSPDAAMRALGAHLSMLGTLNERDFRNAVGPTVLSMIAGYVQLIEATLAEHEGKPAYWATDLRRHRNAVLSGPGRGARYWCPGELAPLDSALRRAISLIGRFGALLQAWPALFAAARYLGNDRLD